MASTSSTASITAETPVGEIVAADPGAARVFEALQIDFCCGGKQALEVVCEERGLDATTVIAMIAAAERLPAAGGDHDLSGASIGEICDHIVSAHHEPTREQLVRIGELAAKVDRAHGAERPALVELHARFDALNADMTAHMDTEERTLFPACREPSTAIPAAKLESLLAEHEAEHAAVGEGLAELRALGGGYDESAALCNTHRVLLHSLREFEADTHQHVHEENNILFPRVRTELATEGSEPTPRRSIR